MDTSVKTGQQLYKILNSTNLFPFSYFSCSGGVNNVVQYVTTSDGQRYILRIYNNGNKSDKVRFEHEVLRQLQLQVRGGGGGVGC